MKEMLFGNDVKVEETNETITFSGKFGENGLSALEDVKFESTNLNE